MEIEEPSRTPTKATYVGVAGTVLGRSSRMRIPLITFRFEETHWYTTEDFIAKVADRIPSSILPYSLFAERKQRERAMETLVKLSRDLDELRSVQVCERETEKQYWKRFAVFC